MNDPADALAAAAARAFATPFAAVLALAPEDGAALWVDGRRHPPAILAAAPDGVEAHCIIAGARDSLMRVMAGARALESAYVAGRVAIAGDMSVMARIKMDGAR